jgi:glycosyltransferase involved in cell wall biosynthesis
MRLGIDVRKISDGGIGEYIRETLTAARELRPDLEIVAFGASGERARLPLEEIEWVPVGAAKYSVAEHLSLPRAAHGRRIDLYHAPHYVLPLLVSGPAVVTVHDLIHLRFPRSPIRWLYARAMLGWALRRAARVIAVSETTARDLRERFARYGSKLRVIPNGVAPRFQPLAADRVAPMLEALGVGRPYVLFVGNCLPHKNVETLVRAWDRLPEPRPGLVLCGRGFDRSAAVQRAIEAATGRERIRIVGGAGTDDLVALYNGAELLASTALYEGFCLPVVEAFACGTPVLGPDAGAVPEIAAGAAMLVAPHRVDTIAAEMYRLLKDQRLRKELVERGKRRAAAFSWTEAARKTLSVYEEVLANS